MNANSLACEAVGHAEQHDPVHRVAGRQDYTREAVVPFRPISPDPLRVFLISLAASCFIFIGPLLARRVLASMQETHGIEVLPPPIPKSVRVAEAPELSVSVLQHAATSKSAEAYRALAATIEERL